MIGYVEPEERWALLRWAAVVVAGLAAGGTFCGLAGVSIGVSVGSEGAAVGWRGGLPLLFVVLGTRVAMERSVARRIREPARATLVASVLAYLLDPLAWDARAGLTQLVSPPGAATFVGDLALWAVAAYLGISWGARSAAPRRERPRDRTWRGTRRG